MFCVYVLGVSLLSGTWNHFVTMTDGAGFLSSVYSHERRDLAATVLFTIPVR